MIHQKQPYAGCFPTTVAMLYNVDIDEVIKVGLEGTPWTSWDEGFNNTRSTTAYRDIVSRILLKFPGPLTLAYNNLVQCSITPFPINLPPNKGAITITNLIANHVVAYEDQVIFDGNMEMGVNWKLWRNHRIKYDWSLVRIITMAEITAKVQPTQPIQLKLNLNVC
ncbi:hypothetical protein LCGC14_2160700 [marine sediment metagenome]|uniref:Uncharacterized protein n=1 Tax=marine sediment metagenome TaxID=412755 RepID=A0A0F9G5N9_9ZZZZ